MDGDWANLPPELLDLIADYLPLGNLRDFGEMCSTWRDAAIRMDRAKWRMPWLMLADKKGTKERDFFSLSRNRIYKLLLPEVKAKKCLSSKGWIMTVGRDWKIRILHPFLRPRPFIVELPGIDKFPDYDHAGVAHMYHYFIQKFVLSTSYPSSPEFTVVVLTKGVGQIGFWRPGDEAWTAIEWRRVANFDVIHYQGKFLIVDVRGKVILLDLDGPNPESSVIFRMPQEELMRDRNCIEQLYLVESQGCLLMVSRAGQSLDLQGNYGTTEFRVFKINLKTSEWIELKTLGDMSLFVGFNSSFSIHVDDEYEKIYGIKANCIYFTDDYYESFLRKELGGGKDMGIYHMEDGTIEPHFEGRSFSHHSPPLWIEPSPVNLAHHLKYKLV